MPIPIHHEETDHSTSTLAITIRSLADSVSAVPINEPPLRMWELNENSTHYDRMVAAPGDEDLIKFWSGWAGIMFITGFVTTSILIPLLRSRHIKKNPFNIYLIFLLIPDTCVAWICGFTCLSNALAGHFTSPLSCYAQSFYMIASIGANSWLNLLVTRQLYKMLDAARQYQKYPMPTQKQVVLEAIGVYLYALFLAALGVIPNASQYWPHKTRLTLGAACVPMDYNTASTVFFYVVFFPLLFGIPLVYVAWAGYQIYKHKMLPPSGRRRILAVYFFRLAAVFVIMWLPGLLLLFVISPWINPWAQWAGGAWSHMQGLVSALLSLLKPDIRKTVVDFWTYPFRPALISVTDRSNPNNNTSSIVTRKPWADSSVYWSSQIQKGKNKKVTPSSNPQHSRISSYNQNDDDLELAAGYLDNPPPDLLLTSGDDDAVSVEINDLELETSERVPDDNDNDNDNMNRNRPHFENLSMIAEEPSARGMFPSAQSRSRKSQEHGPKSNASLAVSCQTRKEAEATDAPFRTIYIVSKK